MSSSGSSSPSVIGGSTSGEEDVFQFPTLHTLRSKHTNLGLPTNTFYGKKNGASSSADVPSSAGGSSSVDSSSSSKNLRPRQLATC